jgi:hypothetical protein
MKVILIMILLSSWGFSQSMNISKKTKEMMFASNEYFPKAGLGLIKAQHLYIVLTSMQNNLLLDQQNEWTGLKASTPEVAIFYENKVWSPNLLPPKFDLSKAIIISFEHDKVRFFDFNEMSGGYYWRESMKHN